MDRPRRKNKDFLDNLSNSVRPFDYIVKAGQTARPKTKEEGRHKIKSVKENGEIMAQYLVAIHHRDDFDPSVETEATH